MNDHADLSFDSNLVEDVVEARVGGELDLTVARALGERLQQLILMDRPVILDMSGVTFANSTALGLFVTAQKQLRERGHRLVIRSPQPNIRRLFDMTALDQFMPVCDTLEEALHAARTPPRPFSTP